MPRVSAAQPARALLENWHWIAGGMVAGAAVTALALWLATPPSPRMEARASSSDAAIEELRLALAREVQAREQIALEVSALRAQLDPAGASAPRASATAAAAAAAPAPTPARDPAVPRPVFDLAALVSAGISPGEAQDVRAHWESVEMEKIRLTDRATREGWVGSAKFNEERSALDQGLRTQLGESDFDRYLYATGKSNRARVTDVLARSPADDAGFQPGDMILSYDGKRVFGIEELRDRATHTRAGSFVPIEVDRGGETVTLRVPGGPLGMMLEAERRTPR
jgi:hypothetical protein